MERIPEATSHAQLLIPQDQASRKDPDAFRASFDVTQAPAAPGCYLMRDRNDKVIYVGKAQNLRARIRSYINEQDERYRVKFLMRRVARIDFLVTTTDKEAVLLENSLIKEHKPRYNVQLKDDKTYVSLRLNVQHDFPRVTVVRKIRRDGAKYFGPYSSANAVRETLRYIQKLFPLRTCTDHVLNNRTRPCLYYQMGQCAAPCVGYIDKERYAEIVEQVQLALQGRSDELKKRLKEQIRVHAEALEFERAAEARDRLYALEQTTERQRAVKAGAAGDTDVFGLHHHGRYTEVQVLFFRGGKLTGGRSFTFKLSEMPIEEAMSSLLLQYYGEGALIPPEILTPIPLDDSETLAAILAEQRDGRVVIHWPQRGDKRGMVEMANRNAKSSFEEKQLAQQANTDLLHHIREALKLPRTPNRIECFDISTTQGGAAVGSMVVFEGGEPNKKRYRHYAIRGVEGQDDFAMMREVLLRRYRRAVSENDLPDLVLVDGGKGQLAVATTVFQDLGIEDLPAASIAKSRAQGDGSRSPERFFVPGRANPIVLPQHAPAVNYLARIRDEAHRFANTYHKKRRGKAMVRTTLVDIPGIGPQRAKKLLNNFGSVAAVRNAAEDDIAALPGFTQALARRVKEHLSGETSTEDAS